MKCRVVNFIVLVNVCQHIFFDIMKLKILFLLNCASPNYIAKLFSLSILSMELSIMYFKRLQVKISILKRCISVNEDCFYLNNSADPNENLNIELLGSRSGLKFCLNLPQLPYFMCTTSDGSGQTAQAPLSLN